MKKSEHIILFSEYTSKEELATADAWLLNQARAMTEFAYAPYSNFNVGATARLINGEIVNGTNQENASSPAGICAERVLLSTASSLHPGVALETIAISYKNNKGESNKPISPCGICRQSLLEYQQRFQNPVRIILGGMEGQVFIIDNAADLLPLGFGEKNLK